MPEECARGHTSFIPVCFTSMLLRRESQKINIKFIILHIRQYVFWKMINWNYDGEFKSSGQMPYENEDVAAF